MEPKRFSQSCPIITAVNPGNQEEERLGNPPRSNKTIQRTRLNKSVGRSFFKWVPMFCLAFPRALTSRNACKNCVKLGCSMASGTATGSLHNQPAGSHRNQKL
eukprot:4408115-Amphidinium_carterae.1